MGPGGFFPGVHDHAASAAEQDTAVRIVFCSGEEKVGRADFCFFFWIRKEKRKRTTRSRRPAMPSKRVMPSLPMSFFMNAPICGGRDFFPFSA
jgi:hypothetical protein